MEEIFGIQVYDISRSMKEEWNKMYIDTCNDILTNKIDLYDDQYYRRCDCNYALC